MSFAHIYPLTWFTRCVTMSHWVVVDTFLKSIGTLPLVYGNNMYAKKLHCLTDHITRRRKIFMHHPHRPNSGSWAIYITLGQNGTPKQLWRMKRHLTYVGRMEHWALKVAYHQFNIVISIQHLIISHN
jgi:hypothetical protein